ncbi:benign gonial cell neoplasm protein [Musca vetustissima]|uniref:benign gonial cell neoplasm protein n=1 Tax=Musca vetustissima TaxID=27455 RepID=UPI002AB7C3FF|nr:benign gonial cell neoplasm protein [Musca vetustissima]
MSSVTNQILHSYISEQLNNFSRIDKRCCIKFMGYLFAIDPQFFAKIVKDLRLRLRPHIDNNGQESVIVFKEKCSHNTVEIMDLKVTTESLKDMYMFHCGSEFCGSQQEFEMSAEFFSPGNVPPTVPPHRFSLGPLKQSIARCNEMGQQSFQMKCPMQPYKEVVLNALSRSRVVVINGGATFGKSTAIPMYIIEKCSEEKRHCKIICVEREQLVAIHNSELLAGHFHEKVGETVAYQVQLQSRISDSSNLVYTTSCFLLRVLMGQSIVDSFRHISHLVVVDAHLHEAFSDLLLRELKVALKYHPYLKVILLSNYSRNYEFLQYFGEGEEISLEMKPHEITKNDLFYYDDIRKLLPESTGPSFMIRKAFQTLPILLPHNRDSMELNALQLDKCLETYERSAHDKCFEFFLYMVQGENANINYRHSVTGRTVLNIASMLGKVEHVKILLQLGADPFITDKLDVDALKVAISMSNLECVELLKVAYFDKSPQIKENYVDHLLILDIINMVTTKNDIWRRGNIIVILPSYQHLIQLNYAILKEKLLGNLPQQIAIFMLHNHTEKSHLDAMITSDPKVIKIILSTDIAETLMCFDDLLYVIDVGRHYRRVFDSEAQCKKHVYEWSAKQNLENRRLLLSQNSGVCFRLIPMELYEQLPEVQTPDLLTKPLDRVCLAVKLLSQHTMVSEYLQETIVKPPFIKVYQAVEHLKKISVFTELEDITWLGCRLIDVPVECHLGKLLVFAILLQCLDPILTIVSFMTTLDPFELSHFIDDEQLEPYRDVIRQKIKDQRKHFAEGHCSDHLMFLRLYQEWQNDLRDDSMDSIPSKYNFTLNGLLEYVCNVRTQLVGALRSSQLIHNKGNLSMHYINLKSNCWPIIKAALVGGLYPSLCVVDTHCNRLKSPNKNELVVHPDSVLRDLNLDSMRDMKYKSPWIIYGQASKSWNCNSIRCNTIIAGISVALFAGPTKLSSSSTKITTPTNATENSECLLHIDDWISFKLNYKEACLLLKTRQHFYNIYVNYLQRCGLLEKFKRQNVSSSSGAGQNSMLFDCIEKILVQEDLANGFKQPERIGLRPKAVPNKLMMTLNGGMLMSSCLYRSQYHHQSNMSTANINFHLRNKQYIMVYRKDLNDMAAGGGDCMMNTAALRHSEWFHTLSTLLDVKTDSNKLTFVVFYTRHPDLLRSVYMVEWNNGHLELYPCFKFNINLHCVLNNANNAALSMAIGQRRNVFALDQNTGLFILNMFAYRNNWLHSSNN